MKNDPTFKLIAAIILAGVIVSFVSPGPTGMEDGTGGIEVSTVAAPVTE